MFKKIQTKLQEPTIHYWVVFFGRTLFYLVIMLVLIYFYHFSHVDGGNFIYNEF